MTLVHAARPRPLVLLVLDAAVSPEDPALASRAPGLAFLAQRFPTALLGGSGEVTQGVGLTVASAGLAQFVCGDAAALGRLRDGRTEALDGEDTAVTAGSATGDAVVQAIRSGRYDVILADVPGGAAEADAAVGAVAAAVFDTRGALLACSRAGLWFARAGDERSRADLRAGQATDVAPTALALLGIPAPAGMTGSTLLRPLGDAAAPTDRDGYTRPAR